MRTLKEQSAQKKKIKKTFLKMQKISGKIIFKNDPRRK